MPARRKNASSWRLPLILVCASTAIAISTNVAADMRQGYDLWKNEHVIVLEYRIKVNPGIHPPAKPPQSLRDLHSNPAAAPMRQTIDMPMIRELMDVRFVNTVDSSPSPRSNGSAKKTTAKTPPIPKNNALQPSSIPYQARLKSDPGDDICSMSPDSAAGSDLPITADPLRWGENATRKWLEKESRPT